MENLSHQGEVIAQIEAERIEYKEIVRRALHNVFKDVLDSAELKKRLELIDRVEFVTAEQMEEIAKANPKEAGALGFIRYEVTNTEIKRYPVVMIESSRVETLHTLLHESVHLMTPEATPVFDSMREVEDQYFSDYLGAYRFNRLRDDKSLDKRSLLNTIPQHNARMMFWEAVTDWIAVSAGALTSQELDEIAESGYFERYWIDYLVQQCSNKSGLIDALKESYVQGNEDSFRWFLQNQTGTKDDEMYDELLTIMGRARQEVGRVDDWMAIVNIYF